MHAIAVWIAAHPLLAGIVASVIIDEAWTQIRNAAWPGVETAKLPRVARVADALAKLVCQIPTTARRLLSGDAPTLPPPPLPPVRP